MGVNARGVKAINAMKDMGISEKKVKPVLKDLLRLYDKNWELIEDDNYAVLIEAIFEEKEEEATQKDEEEQLLEESAGPPLKKMRLRGNADAPSASGECELTLRWSTRESDDLPMAQSVERDPILSQVKDKDVQEALALPSTLSRPDEEEQSQLCLRDRSANHPISHQSLSRDKGKDPILPSVVYCRDEIFQSCTHTGQNVARHDPTSPQTQLETKEMERSSLQITHNEKGCLQARPSFAERFKEQKIETGIILTQKKKLDDGLIKPKNEPFDDHSHLEVPLAVMPPIISEGTIDIARHDPTSPQTQLERKEMECSFLQMTHNEQGCLQARPSFAECFKEQKIDNGFIKPKNEPLDDLSHLEVPLAVMPPIISKGTIDIDLVVEDGHSTLNGSSVQVNGVESLACKDNHNVNCDKACESAMGSELATVPESPMNFDIASSLLGEVKICLSCSQSIKRPGVHVPSVDEVLKAVEDRCLRSYRILDPNFSILKLFQETCQSFLDLSSQQDRIQLPTSFSDGSSNGQPSPKAVLPGPPSVLLSDGIESYNNPQSDGNLNVGRAMEEQPNSTNSDSLVAVSRQGFAVDSVRPLHDLNDISKGQERVRISGINEVSSEPYPSSFYYIRRNTVYQSAYLNFSLARIGDDCCLNCFGDCLSSSIPCACARDAGGDFAYTLDGLVKEEFLKECISMNRDPSQQQRYFCCKQCPKEGLSNPCKGHLVRRFIKECWSKCGCNKQCGNRVVQRGISCNLQVFFTSEGKGWGVRSLQDLPKGTFVCEYVGEVLTCTEIYERNRHSTGNEKHTYPVLLDAAWGLKGDLKDEEALCLDGKYYGNVARFINHRCFDANLVEIPVKIENQDHHYYHLALFTTRDVDALEELTWDYGINFDDDHPTVKAFRCCCKSNYCRDLKRYRRVTQKSGCIT